MKNTANYKNVVLAIISKVGKVFLLHMGIFAQLFSEQLPYRITITCLLCCVPHTRIQALQGQDFLCVVSYIVRTHPPSHTALAHKRNPKIISWLVNRLNLAEPHFELPPLRGRHWNYKGKVDSGKDQ